MSKIELRLSDVDPPIHEPKRTIYRDLANLPDPTKLGLTIRYFNHDDVDLYFQITGSGPGYTFETVNLGLLSSGTNTFRNLDEFASKAKPSEELTENITLTLKAYTDSGYTNLKWTFERVVQVVWIDSSDPSYTVDVDNDFDDGTVQGWAVANELQNSAGYPTIAVATDYVLSAPYSCKMTQKTDQSATVARARLYKSFTTPNKDVIYAVLDLREAKGGVDSRIKNVKIQRDTTLLVFFGKPGDLTSGEYFVLNKWFRTVVPLPKNTTLEIRIVQEWYLTAPGASPRQMYLWLDDFKIISK